jgi:nucleotide-binding universal stress UspA family protein
MRKFLAIVDHSPECRAAVLFAAWRARITQGRLVLLTVLEPIDPALFTMLGARARAEAEASAQVLLDGFAAIVRSAAGVDPEQKVGEGDVRAAVGKLAEEDPEVRVLVLAAGAGRDGPGPLVGSLARGGLAFGGRSLPVTVVPGDLADHEIAALAQ